MIETIRAECLDWSLILGRRHLDRTLRTYAEHYNRGRPHRGLDLATPLAEAGEPVPVSPPHVHRRDLLGGLIHEYYGRRCVNESGFSTPTGSDGAAGSHASRLAAASHSSRPSIGML